MPRFFVDSIEESPIEISGGDARHIALSLRMKQGDGLVRCDGDGGEAVCKIASLCPESVILDVEERRKSLAEPKTRVTLYQAIPKSDKLEYIVQKAVELGAYRIVPVLTSRCISRPDEKSAAKKLERLRKIAAEAAKQSGRGIVPQVGGVLNLILNPATILAAEAKTDYILIKSTLMRKKIYFFRLRWVSVF